MGFRRTMIEDMNKIKQLKTLLATKDARQLRKDGEELLKAWEEEEEQRCDDRVYQKVGKRYEPIGLMYERSWLSNGIWVVQSNGSSLFNGTHYAQEFGIVKVGSNQPADFSTLAAQEKLYVQLIDLLQHQQVEVEGCFMHYPAAHDIAKQIMQLLNNKKMTSK